MGNAMDSIRFGVGIRVRIRDDRSIGDIQDGVEKTINGIKHEISITSSIIELRASEFSSEQAATRYLPRLICALWSLALADKIAFEPCFEQAQAIRPEDPELAAQNMFRHAREKPKRLDLLISGVGHYVFRIGDMKSAITMFPPSLSISSTWNNCEPIFTAGINCSNATEVAEDEDLTIALSLYVSQHYEASVRARFILLISALEALAPASKRHQTAVSAFESFEASLKELLQQSKTSEEREALKALIEDTRWKMEDSISQRIRSLVKLSIPEDDPSRDREIKNISKAYSVRSTLLHKGRVSEDKLREAMENTRRILKHILTTRLGL
ncbi:HEPN domain-containing protein [Jannaschia formosa]|uniref:HEPN domain-containing protein n=1 Tax=Jannaschia formosa TaxID=2259592 RepID=UPI001074C5DD|nr:HEPN domain-containing protein [Jannaschia formosa]TFL15947.1 hypothetical protein DR046_22670 [Jannaschia formosa]